jgi:hypothetical protein
MRQQAGRQAGRQAGMELEGEAGPRLCISASSKHAVCRRRSRQWRGSGQAVGEGKNRGKGKGRSGMGGRQIGKGKVRACIAGLADCLWAGRWHG